MIEKFLKAKHWQLFLLLFGLPMIAYFFIMASMISQFSNAVVESENIVDPEIMFEYLQFFPLIMLVVMAVFFGWFWSIGVGLQSKLPEHITMNVRLFKAFLLIPLAYILCICISFFIGISMVRFSDNIIDNPGIFTLIVPLHLFSMFCIFYSMYFVAKTIKTAELQRKVSFGDYAGEFFLLWFYFIGVWVIQPKINKMVGEGYMNQLDENILDDLV